MKGFFEPQICSRHRLSYGGQADETPIIDARCEHLFIAPGDPPHIFFV
jgi:hypothetical protein